MRLARMFVLLVPLFIGCGSSGQVGNPNDPAITNFNDDEMEAAIAKAQGSVEEFLKVMKSGDGSDFAVKVPITDDNGTEHFWLIDIRFKNGEFTGTINNDPGIVQNVHDGQKWTTKKGEISDWLYFRDGKMFGNYTLRPLLKTMPPEQAAELKSMLAEP